MTRTRSSWIMFLMLTVLLSSCGGGKSEDEFSVTGTITNLPANQHIVLEKMLPNMAEVVDSVLVEPDGSFSFLQPADPNTFFQMRLSTGYAFPFLPQNAALEFEADFNQPSNWKIKGNPENEILKGFFAERGARGKAYKKARQAHIMTPKSKGMDKWRAAEANADRALIHYREYMRNFIDTTSVPAFRGFAAFSMNIEANHYFLNKLAYRLQEELPGHVYTTGLREQLNLYGDVFVRIEPQDIEGENPAGKNAHLKDEVGKMTLVYFWASYCAFSRQQNLLLHELYEQYKDQGFSIYAMSIDDYKEDWLGAIEEDRMNWPGNIMLEKGWESQVFAEWAVPSVPTTFLLDHRGVIMEKNVRAEELQEDMETLLTKYTAQ